MRYVIETQAVLGGLQWPIEVTLTDRDRMIFRMLLGRKALEHHFAIDPAKSYLSGRALAGSYRGMRKKRGSK